VAKFLFTFIVLIAHADSSPWFEKVRHLSDEEPAASNFLKQLKSDPKLESNLKSSLESGDHHQEALMVIAKLNLQKLWPDAFTLLKQNPEWQTVETLQGLDEKQSHPEWKTWVREQFRAPWSSMSRVMKLAVVNAAVRSKTEVDRHWFDHLFDEPSMPLRVQAVQILALNMKAHSEDPAYEGILKKVLRSDPYQFRMAGFLIVMQMPKEQKQVYRKEIDTCAAKDENERVRSQCAAIKKSF
jgi:hypothetical protein